MKKSTRRFLNKVSKFTAVIGFIYTFLVISNDDIASKFIAVGFPTKQVIIGISIIALGGIIYLISRFNPNALKKRKWGK